MIYATTSVLAVMLALASPALALVPSAPRAAGLGSRVAVSKPLQAAGEIQERTYNHHHHHFHHHHHLPTTAGAPSTAGAMSSDPRDQALAATATWIKTVTSHTTDAPRNVAALYSPQALFWGTVSDVPRSCPQEVLSYFEFFARQRGLRVAEYTPVCRMYNDIAINAGTYVFKVEKEGQTAAVSARYTFAYERQTKPNGETGWMIIEHHSSAQVDQPEPLTASDRKFSMSAGPAVDREPDAPTVSAKLDEATIKKETLEATQLWMDTVTSGTETAPADTAGLYSDRALFQGTVSGGLRKDKHDTRAYFEFFTKLNNLRVLQYDPIVRTYGHNIAMNLGSYTFAYDLPDGSVKKVPARYTFIYQLAEDAGEEAAPGTRWKIIQHHSSAMPEMPAALKALDEEFAAATPELASA